jgi:MULE transposase domain
VTKNLIFNFSFGLQIDGTFLKSQSGGTLLTAVFKTSNNSLLLLGYAVVSSETKESWTWFLNCLKTAGMAPGFFISDRDKGLLPSIAEIFPETPHHYCVRHLLNNFCQVFKGKALSSAVWVLVKAKTQIEYENAIAEIKNLSRGEEAFQWLQNAGLHHFCTFLFTVPVFGTLTSNNAESINAALAGIREMSICDMIINIEKWHFQKIYQQKTIAQTIFPVTPFILKTVEALVLESSFLESIQTSVNGFAVQFSATKKQNHAVVELGTPPKCSCAHFMEFHYPCVHIIKAAQQSGMNVLQFCSEIWSKNWYLMAFDQPAMLTSLISRESLTVNPLLPPILHKKRGRPKKRRIESQQALGSGAKNREITCKKCHQIGHNKRTCRF